MSGNTLGLPLIAGLIASLLAGESVAQTGSGTLSVPGTRPGLASGLRSAGGGLAGAVVAAPSPELVLRQTFLAAAGTAAALGALILVVDEVRQRAFGGVDDEALSLAPAVACALVSTAALVLGVHSVARTRHHAMRSWGMTSAMAGGVGLSFVLTYLLLEVI